MVLVMALLPVRGTRWRWFLDCAALPVVFVLAASPVLLLNTIQFHSPFKTGYDFWVPYITENHLFFSLRYIPGNALALWRESTLQPPMNLCLAIFSAPTLISSQLFSFWRAWDCFLFRATGSSVALF